MTQAEILLHGPDGKETMEILVDTGSLYTWVSENILKRIGVSPSSRRRFTTIEGKILERSVGEAVVEYDGESAHCIVVFGQPGDVNVMGVTALENLGLEVNPTTQTLKKSESLAAY